MKFNYLEVRNFQSLEKIHFDFSQGLSLIDGWNYDLDDANGVGKSSLLNAFVYALYGNVPYAAKISDLIRDGAKKMYTEISLSIKAKDILIKRSRNPNFTKLYVNDVEVKGVVREIEKRIITELELNFDQFVQIVYVYQDAKDRFIDLNDTSKKEFLTSILDLDKYTLAYKAAHKKISQIDLDSSNLLGKIFVLDDNITSHLGSLVGLKIDLKEFREKGDVKLQEETEKANVIKKEVETLANKKLLAENNNVLNELIAQRNKVDEKVQALLKVQFMTAEIKEKLDKSLFTIAGLESDLLNPPNICGECGQSLPSWNHEDYFVKINGKIKRLTDERAQLEDKLHKLENMQKQSDELPQEKQDLELKISVEMKNGPEKYEREIKIKDQELKFISYCINTLQLKEQALVDQIEGKQETMGLMRKQHADFETQLADLYKDKKYLLEIKKIYSPSGIKAYVFNSLIDGLNSRIETYLDILFNGLVKFQYITDEKSGKLIEECIYEGTSRSKSVMSGGEQRRLSLATDLALSDTISKRLAVYPNILILDEATKGMAPIGLEKTMTLLQDLEQTKDTILVVDHASEFKTSFNNVISLEKRNGKTRLKT